MPSAESLQPDNTRFMALFVGPKHSGKTVAECSFPHPIKVFDFDGRIRGILGAKWIEKKGIDYEYYPPRVGKNSVKTCFQKFNDDLEALLTMTQTGQCPYQTVIMDSLTSETFAFMCDAIPLTHKTDRGEKGKFIGSMAMPGPEDYGFEANGTYQALAFFRSLPIPNVIVSAHIVERYGKIDPSNQYSESVVVGEKLSVRDKIGANVGIYFDHIFRFDRRVSGNQERFYVQFRGDLANTAWHELPNGEIDITGKDFYNQVLMPYVRKPEAAVAK